MNHLFCVAPMMDWTDRHDRVFLRLFSSATLLYTEMVTAAALQYGDASYLLQHDPSEHPVALQLGGSDPAQLAAAALLGEQAGFDEINLNLGCPSDRVQSGAFGACLMAKPELVAECLGAMQDSVSVPVTVKTRIGIDELDSEEHLLHFVERLASAGCRTFIIHARKAILAGLSPKENREIPPLIYPRVYRVKHLFPELEIVINGGITSLDQAKEHLQQVDGVMLGREAYQNPFILAGVDSMFFGLDTRKRVRLDYLRAFLPYVEEELSAGTQLNHITRHILGLFKGQKGGRQFRRHLSENAHRNDAGLQVLEDAIAYVS